MLTTNMLFILANLLGEPTLKKGVMVFIGCCIPMTIASIFMQFYIKRKEEKKVQEERRYDNYKGIKE